MAGETATGIEFTAYRRAEIIHYAHNSLIISSYSNTVSIDHDGAKATFRLPQPGWKRHLLNSRLARRAARLDKCNCVPIFDANGAPEALVAVRQGQVFHIDLASGTITPTLALRQCRNVLHQSITLTPSGNLFFGEYGHNGERNSVPVYKSKDHGRSWKVVYEFPAGSIKHVHGCYWDRHAQKVWVCTGDFAGENQVLSADEDFIGVKRYGDGSQAWRTCYPFFFPDRVVWAMDSQLETSCLCVLDRATGELTKRQEFPGPVWYAKELTDGWYLLATACEIGPGVKDNKCHIFASRDALDWHEVYSVRHDGLPKRYFKFGVLGFADGEQSSDSFYLFAEAVRHLDGKSFQCKLVRK
ncbi:MAG: hypothetical protein KDA60_08820 [Planctomycetales bacterium]|nr:hypothetical protein [Planctomycetales bacterium]